MKKQSVLVADDHEVMRHGILLVLEKTDMVDKVHEAKNSNEVLTQCNHKDIDIVLLDINMPGMNGIEAAKKIKEQFPEIEIIALSMLNDEESIRKMLEAGASGYILKSSGKADIIEAIDNVSHGKPFYSEEVVFKVIGHYKNPKSITGNETELTEREVEILRLIVDEYTNQEIADELYISKRTVDTHRTNLLKKTNSKNTAGLVRYALKNNLV